MKRFLIIALFPTLLLGCDNFLDVVPEEDMTTLNTIFETREQAYTWLKGCYTFLQYKNFDMLNDEAFLGSDELVIGDYLLSGDEELPGNKIRTGMQNSLNPYGDFWSQKLSGERRDFYTAINHCNIFIDKIDQVYNMEEKEKREWKAEVKALKAYYYFELIRRYGPIILVPQNIDPNVDVAKMKVPRSHVDTCFAHIVRLCDEAAKDLPPFNEKERQRLAYFNKEAALALKARALCYHASDLFNGNPDYATFTNKNGEPLFSSTKDSEKWKRAAEAAEEAIQTCLANGKHLVNDKLSTTDLQTNMLNIEYSTYTFSFENDEVLFMVKTGSGGSSFDEYTIPDITTDPYHYNTGTVISPSLKMVEMFYTANGLPIDQDPTWGGGNIYSLTKETDPYYSDVVMLDTDIPVLHTKREPRFYADIAADRCYWRLGTRQENLYAVKAYQGETFGLKEKRLISNAPQNITGYWMKKWSYSILSLYNYPQDKYALGEQPFPVIRMAELYLIAAEAWNEYLDAPDNRVYDNLNEIRKRAGIPTVQESWAMAKDKNKVNTKEGMRDIIRQEWNIEYAFEGFRYWNLRRWKTAHIELSEKSYGWNVLGNTKEKFYNNFTQPAVVESNNKFVAPKDYLYPIRSEEILISGCVQNPGW